MSYQIAQLNIARFIKPADHPDNADFVNSLDRVNAVAEEQAGFVWRFTGSGNDALDVQAFEDPNVAVNMSVWTDLGSLANFVYRNEDHISIMRRRREWFSKVEFRLVLWWVREGHTPTLDEAKRRLAWLKENGPSESAFTFRHPFPSPSGQNPDPILDECA
ncbi:MAG: DUF3291 domain-containing protein [Woeseiaceae bacterium]|nr:DUF3291 domain-containing protein [Woeseiaceae bacterium]